MSYDNTTKTSVQYPQLIPVAKKLGMSYDEVLAAIRSDDLKSDS